MSRAIGPAPGSPAAIPSIASRCGPTTNGVALRSERAQPVAVERGASGQEPPRAAQQDDAGVNRSPASTRGTTRTMAYWNGLRGGIGGARRGRAGARGVVGPGSRRTRAAGRRARRSACRAGATRLGRARRSHRGRRGGAMGPVLVAHIPSPPGRRRSSCHDVADERSRGRAEAVGVDEKTVRNDLSGFAEKSSTRDTIKTSDERSYPAFRRRVDRVNSPLIGSRTSTRSCPRQGRLQARLASCEGRRSGRSRSRRHG